MAADAASHRIKTISFLGRRVPVLLQDVNGPCPLLAIANVLLLRNQLQLPAGAGEVSQDRLVAMVAERLLDSNTASLEGGSSSPGGGLSEEQRASLAHNLSDAIGLLPKLCTGIDVNLRFHDIAGFEYTQETAVFDLLDIPLVHGWLVDPQDEPTARAVGSRTYNELVVQLVTSLGSAATSKTLTPPASLHRGQHAGSGGLTPFASGAMGTATSGPLPAISEHGGEPGALQQAQQALRQGQFVDAEALSAALQNSLLISREAAQAQGGGATSGAGDAEPGSSGPASARSWAGRSGALGLADSSRVASSLSSLQASDSMKSMVNRMLTDLVSDAFTSGTTLASAGHFAPASGSTAGAGGAEAEERGEEATSALRPALGGSSAGGSSSDLPAGAAAACAGAAGDGGLEAPLGSSPLSSGTLAWWAELGLEVDEAAAAAGHGNAVCVRLTMRAPRPPPSPFDLSPSASASAAASQHEAGAAAAARRSTPATPHPSLASMLPEQPESGSATGSATPGPLATSAAGAGEAEAASSSPGAASAAAAGPGSSGASPAGEAAVRDALLVQQFLEGNPSQLTFHGLVALQEGLRPNQLAVFFRNNHFNTLFKGPDSQLYILATDEGFQFESDVVWEHLISVDGDTELVGGDFKPFRPHASHEEAAAAQAAARQDDWDAAAAAAAGGDTHDADLALAMQLQAEEEERVRREEERQRALMARQQQEAEQQRRASADHQRRAQQQQVLPSQRRPSSASSSGSGSGKPKKKKSATDSCSIM